MTPVGTGGTKEKESRWGGGWGKEKEEKSWKNGKNQGIRTTWRPKGDSSFSREAVFD